jgi:hypothetical protein
MRRHCTQYLDARRWCWRRAECAVTILGCLWRGRPRAECGIRLLSTRGLLMASLAARPASERDTRSGWGVHPFDGHRDRGTVVFAASDGRGRITRPPFRNGPLSVVIVYIDVQAGPTAGDVLLARDEDLDRSASPDRRLHADLPLHGVHSLAINRGLRSETPSSLHALTVHRPR